MQKVLAVPAPIAAQPRIVWNRRRAGMNHCTRHRAHTIRKNSAVNRISRLSHDVRTLNTTRNERNGRLRWKWAPNTATRIVSPTMRVGRFAIRSTSTVPALGAARGPDEPQGQERAGGQLDENRVHRQSPFTQIHATPSRIGFLCDRRTLRKDQAFLAHLFRRQAGQPALDPGALARSRMNDHLAVHTLGPLRHGQQAIPAFRDRRTKTDPVVRHAQHDGFMVTIRFGELNGHLGRGRVLANVRQGFLQNAPPTALRRPRPGSSPREPRPGNEPGCWLAGRTPPGTRPSPESAPCRWPASSANSGYFQRTSACAD